MLGAVVLGGCAGLNFMAVPYYEKVLAMEAPAAVSIAPALPLAQGCAARHSVYVTKGFCGRRARRTRTCAGRLHGTSP